MQNRYYWTCDAIRVKRKSFLISLFLHTGLFSLLFLPSGTKKIQKNEIFIVKMVSLSEIKINSSPDIEIPKNLISKPEKIKKELPKTTKKIEKDILPEFSSEKYKQQLYAKLSKQETDNVDFSKKFKRNIDIKIPEIKSSSIDFYFVQGENIEIPSWYISLLQRKIKEKWEIKDLLSDLSAIVSFRIYREGKVENIVIEKSSGYKKFDNSIIEAIKKVKDWPEFPETIRDRYLDIIIEFKTEG